MLDKDKVDTTYLLQMNMQILCNKIRHIYIKKKHWSIPLVHHVGYITNNCVWNKLRELAQPGLYKATPNKASMHK
jgi:hypothetical protein